MLRLCRPGRRATDANGSQTAPATRMLIRTNILALAVLTAIVAVAGGPKPRIYRNEEFGITAPIPKEALPCFAPADEHDHGPALLLGTTDPKQCDDSDKIESNRYVGIFAFFNALEDIERLPDFRRWDCAVVASRPCGRAPEGLRVEGLRSASAEVIEPRGWIDVIVVTQAGKPDPRYDPKVPTVNYDLRLHTKAAFLNEDLRVFREVLRTIRLAPPD